MNVITLSNEEKISSLKAELDKLQKSILKLQLKKNKSINDYSKIEALHNKINAIELNIETLER